MTKGLFAILALLAGMLTASNGGQRPVLRTSAEAVVVEAAVWDGGRPVRGLSAGDFELTDNGVPQQISVVAMGRGPIRVDVVADLGTAERPLRDRIRAAVSLIAAAAPREDECSFTSPIYRCSRGFPAALTATGTGCSRGSRPRRRARSSTRYRRRWRQLGPVDR